MYTMKKILNVLFVTLGVIFAILIIGALSIYLFTQYGPSSFATKQTSQNASSHADNTSNANETQPQSSSPSFLSANQRATLESFGIDPNSIPQTLTTEQMTCFETTLGTSRVAEIKAGASPSAMEFFKAKGCI
jgi:hypothetical protein